MDIRIVLQDMYRHGLFNSSCSVCEKTAGYLKFNAEALFFDIEGFIDLYYTCDGIAEVDFELCSFDEFKKNLIDFYNKDTNILTIPISYFRHKFLFT